MGAARDAAAGLLAGVLAAAFAGAEGTAAETPALADLERRLQGMASFRADFEQTVQSRFGETLQTTSGRMHLQRPGRLRWEVAAPYPQLVLADGESLWVHDPDLAQVTVQPLAEAVAGTPAVFLTGLPGAAPDLARDFAVTVPLAPTPPDRLARYALRPRDPGSVLREAVLAFGEGAMLRGIDIVDHLGQTTRIVFRAAALNPVLPSGLFVFEVPPEADVIGHVPAARSDRPGQRKPDEG